jgi:hypothetical protein
MIYPYLIMALLPMRSTTPIMEKEDYSPITATPICGIGRQVQAMMYDEAHDG